MTTTELNAAAAQDGSAAHVKILLHYHDRGAVVARLNRRRHPRGARAHNYHVIRLVPFDASGSLRSLGLSGSQTGDSGASNAGGRSLQETSPADRFHCVRHGVFLVLLCGWIGIPVSRRLLLLRHTSSVRARISGSRKSSVVPKKTADKIDR